MNYVKYIEYTDEELAGARKYADMFLMYKDEPEWSALCADMAKNKLNFAQIFHDKACDEIKTAKLPRAMAQIWEIEEDYYEEEKAIIKRMLEL